MITSHYITIYNNLYSILLESYTDRTFNEEKCQQIPTVLAIISVVLNDTSKIIEIRDKFGLSPFTTVPGPWGKWVLQQVDIIPRSFRNVSPTNIQDI